VKAVIQRVRNATVTVEERSVGDIGRGLLVYLGVACGDEESDIEYLTEKTANLRIFEDHLGKMNLSVKDIGGAVLVISQFTLLADTRKGRRPYFGSAAPPEIAERLYKTFITRIVQRGVPVETGLFGQRMMVEYVNEGPVTILLDSRDKT
jgi:D-aminoacyl-tRNA deacylase